VSVAPQLGFAGGDGAVCGEAGRCGGDGGVWLEVSRSWDGSGPQGGEARRRNRSVTPGTATQPAHLALTRIAAVAVHEPVAQPLARSQPVVGPAEDSDVGYDRQSALRARDHVIELGPKARAAEAARVER